MFSQQQSQGEQLGRSLGHQRTQGKNRLRREQGGSGLLPYFQRSVVECGGSGEQSPGGWRAGLGCGLCGDSRLERESAGVLERGTDLFGWLPGCEGEINAKSSGLGHFLDPLSLTGLGWQEGDRLGHALPQWAVQRASPTQAQVLMGNPVFACRTPLTQWTS